MTSNSHRYCSVRECKNYVTENVSMHGFPQDPNLAREWKIKLKISKPISKFMCVCSEHFKADDFTLYTRNRKLKRLKKGVIPSQKIPKGVNIKNKKSSMGLSNKTRSKGSSDNPRKDEKRRVTAQRVPEIEVVDEVTSHNTRQPQSQLTQSQEPITNSLDVSVERGVQSSFPIYNLADMMNSNYSMKCFTGVDLTLINTLVDCSINALTFNSDDIPDNLKLRIVLVLCKLKCNLSFECLAIIFNLPKTVVTRYFFLTLSLLATVLRPIVKWPTREEIQANIPGCKQKFENMRVVVHCIDITIRKNKFLADRQESYSHYKNTLTLKVLTGITLSGLIAYVSPCHGKETGDKAVFSAEDFTSTLESHEEVIMNKGCMHEEGCEDYLKLIQPLFLDKNKHLSMEESTFTPNTSRTHIHVDRAIQKMKSFKIISSQFEWSMIPHIDDVITVIAGLLNLSPPIHSSETF